MTAAGRMTVEEYLALDTKPLSEYREGVLYPRTKPTTLHGILELLLALRLWQLGLAAAPEVTVKISASDFSSRMSLPQSNSSRLTLRRR
jgi:hypothetical protein